MAKSKTKTKQRSKDKPKRGLMTISPPAKVSPSTLAGVKVLASGVDSLNLALDVIWEDPLFLQTLEIYRKNAQDLGKPFPMVFRIPKRNEELLFNFAPYGTKGYKWIISGNEYAIRLYDSVLPKSRPNVMIEIRSETIWRRGIREAIDVVLDALRVWKANIVKVRTSRIDLCMDVLMPKELWTEELFENMTARARSVAKYTKSNDLTGVQIGRGKLSARIYDKDLEIRTISHKTWMYDIWGLDEIGEQERAIRVEFQFLREPIKELGFDTIDETLQNLESLWAYCSKEWLKFQTNPGKHHTQRKTLLWWGLVQNSFLGIQDPIPAIRAKSIQASQIQLSGQIVGLVTSMAATLDLEEAEPLLSKVTQKDLIDIFKQAIRITQKTNQDLCESINDKRAKHHKGKSKYQAANEERLAKGLPVDRRTIADAREDASWIHPDDDS